VIKLTKQRRIIYDILKESKKPLNAEMIFEKLKKDTMNLSTVYRTIDFFEKNNLVLKFHFNGTSYYFLNTEKHHHYFICTECLSMTDIDCHLSNTIHDLEKNHGFLVTNHEMTVYGLCKECQKHSNI